MSMTTGLPPNVGEYLGALRAELADLAPEERDDLLSEVEPSLLEAAADDDEPIAARLGPAAAFAADLRASAGLPPAPHGEPAAPRGLRASLRELARHPAAAGTASVLRELAPVWWVARAYVAVEALAMVTGEGAQTWPSTRATPRFRVSAVRRSGWSCSPSRSSPRSRPAWPHAAGRAAAAAR